MTALTPAPQRGPLRTAALVVGIGCGAILAGLGAVFLLLVLIAWVAA